METPKSKLFGFRRSGNLCSPSNNRPVGKEVEDLETLPISPHAIPTSSRLNPAVGQSSPQFVVGWNDGAGSEELDMMSPIRAAPVLRNIRRCPNSFKAPKKKSKDNKEDILQCIDWSKNLFENTKKDREIPEMEEKTLPNTEPEILGNENVKEVTESRSETKNTSINLLDDSVDEMMILCSQIVEENLPVSRHPPILPVPPNIPRKHALTPEEPTRKKPKMDIGTHTKSLAADNTSVNVKKCDHASFKIPSRSESKAKPEVKATNSGGPSRVLTKAPTVPNQNLFEELLNDDEDDLFGSFDFHCIDKKLHHTQTKGVPVKSVSSHANICGPKLDHNRNPAKPTRKYTSEEIEKRRQEAKKRLLFNKKYKSV